jgi:hypothetical protein
MVLADADVQSRTVNSSALADDDTAGFGKLPAIDLNPKSFAV